jgi:hypothetical protein
VEAASYQSAAGKAVRVGLLQAEQQRSNGGQLQAKQLEVNWVTAGRSSRGSVYLGSSTVLALSGDSRLSV